MAVYLLRVSSRLPFDVLTWTFFAVIVACGGLFVGGAVLAWQNIRQTPAILLRACALLMILSVWPLVPHYREARRAAEFMQRADSARGAVLNRFYRGGPILTVAFEVGSDSYKLTRRGRSQEAHLRVGDSVWTYFQPGAPQSAVIGRPGPDPEPTMTWLAIIWVIGGVFLLGYGALLLRRGASVRSPEQVGVRDFGSGAA